jgi:FAD/FMN-containing dehydrogenase
VQQALLRPDPGRSPEDCLRENQGRTEVQGVVRQAGGAVTGSGPDWGALQGAIAGEVVLPGSPAYEVARKPAIARFHQVRPQAVVRCVTPADVAETISLAGRAGLRVAARSGGHCFAGHSSTGGVVIDVTPMRSVSVSDGVTMVGAGARLGELYDALAVEGRTVAAGCGPAVGIAGLTLGGGLGILGRTHGLTCDQLQAAQVVLADGRVVDCDDHHDQELLWALRGAGGGNFGVVTRLVLATVPAPAATSFHLVWPYASAAAVIGVWQAWAPDGPDALAASLLLTATGDPDRPPVVNLFGAMLGTESDTAGLLEELVARVGTDPASATRRHASWRETKRHLAEHGPGEDRPDGHMFSKSEFFARPLPADAVAGLVAHLQQGRRPGQSRELDFTPWGGAYNRLRGDATAFVHRDARFLLKHAVVIDPDTADTEREAARAWLSRSWALLHRWGSAGAYQNFPDPDLQDWAHAYYGTNLRRLLRVKARYDPGNFFRFPQSLPGHVPGGGART